MEIGRIFIAELFKEQSQPAVSKRLIVEMGFRICAFSGGHCVTHGSFNLSQLQTTLGLVGKQISLQPCHALCQRLG